MSDMDQPYAQNITDLIICTKAEMRHKKTKVLLNN